MRQPRHWHDACINLRSQGMSYKTIGQKLNVGRSTIGDYINSLKESNESINNEVTPVRYEHENQRILVISDIHAPYHHPNTLEFLEGLHKKYNFTRVISVGDTCDMHSSSFHPSDPDLDSAGIELKKTQEFMKQLENLFPKMDILDSNHDSMYYRKAKVHGIPLHIIKSYNEILGVGDGWKWHNDMIIELPTKQKVYMCHGKSANGLKLSQNMGMSCLQGHFHSAFNISYWSSPESLNWSMQVGCLIDDKSLAMAYNKLTLNRPIIGCGIIIDGVPSLEVMKL